MGRNSVAMAAGVIYCGGRAGTWGCKGLFIACHGGKQGRDKSGTGVALSQIGLRFIALNRKRWGFAQRGLQRAPELCRVLRYCAGTCRTERGFI